MLAVFIAVFAVVTLLGFRAARWRPGDLNRLQEWGLGGRRFGTITSWFMLGGDIYTAYSFIAVPALVFGSGALGFFAVPYLVIIYPIVFIVLPKFWTVARHRGYVTPADFVRERFGSSTLALLVALTGILATMPYIALQIYGIEVSIAQMGIPIEISLIIAFVILPSDEYSAYATLALGSALALFLYPHTRTGVLSTNSRKVVRRNAALLPAYTLLLGMIALLGYVAIA